MTKLDKDIVALIHRSPDKGDGWRSVSPACWQLIEKFDSKELLDIDAETRMVRLNGDGLLVADYL